MIIETTANQFFRVWETEDPALAHVWYGIQVKLGVGGWQDIRTGKRGKLNITLVRKQATQIVRAS